MKLTNEGIREIKSHEGLRLKAYPDPGSKDGHPWTIGYGHTALAGPPSVHRGMVITEAEAEEIFARDIAKFADKIRPYIKRELNDNQFSAFVSFAYNVGIGGFSKSSALEAANQGRLDLVPSRLSLWNKNDGKVMPGLVNRRAAEGRLFMKPVAAPHPEIEAEEMPPVTNRVEPSEGKPMAESKTVLAQVAQWLAAGGAAALTALGAIPWQTAAVMAGASLAGFGLYIIYERRRHSRESGI